MKRCPQCHRVETDDALKFCRVDGATLVSESSPPSAEVGTAQLASAASSSETKVDPSFADLRGDPRFKDLLKRMNLPE